MIVVSREEALNMVDAHIDGCHDDLPREGCPECEGKELRDYPTADEIERRREKE